MNRRTPATLLYRYFQLKPTFIIGIRFDFCIFTTPLALHTRSILLDAAPILLAPNIRYCFTAAPRTAGGIYREDDSGQIKVLVSICFSNIFVQCLVQFTCPYFLSTKWNNQMVRNVNDELCPDQGSSGSRRPRRNGSKSPSFPYQLI